MKIKTTPFVHQDKGVGPDEAAVSALSVLLLLVCLHSKSGLLSLHPQCPHTVFEPPRFCLSLKRVEEPARTVPGHDAIQLLFATWDEFLEERGAFINCSVTESQRLKSCFSTWLSCGVEISITKVKSSTTSGATVTQRLILWLFKSVIPVSLAWGTRPKLAWQGERPRKAEWSFSPCSHHLPACIIPGLSKKDETSISLQSTWKKHQSCKVLPAHSPGAAGTWVSQPENST